MQAKWLELLKQFDLKLLNKYKLPALITGIFYSTEEGLLFRIIHYRNFDPFIQLAGIVKRIVIILQGSDEIICKYGMSAQATIHYRFNST